MIKFPNKIEIGKWGEATAADFLKADGYEIVALNYRCRYGEIDLIGRDGEVWCFIEVKTRRNSRYGAGWDAVSVLKQEKLRNSAQFFLMEQRLFSIPVRFDVVSIDFVTRNEYRIQLFKNAFR
jgi:putative endonuclease